MSFLLNRSRIYSAAFLLGSLSLLLAGASISAAETAGNGDAAVATAPEKSAPVETKKENAEPQQTDDAADEDVDYMNESDLARKVSKSAVRVRFYLQTDQGRYPDDGEQENSIRQELPFLIGGFLWDATTVVIPDPVIHEPFIRRVEVEAGGKTVKAALKSYMVMHKAALLTISERLPGVDPVVFTPAPASEEWSSLRAVYYGYDSGDWLVAVSGIGGEYIRLDTGEEMVSTSMPGLAVNPSGDVVGLVFSEYAGMSGPYYPWRGERIRHMQMLTVDEMKQKQEKLQSDLKQIALDVTFRFRENVDVDDDTDIDPEVHAVGFRIAPDKLLIPTPLERDVIARLIGIEVAGKDGNSVQAEFSGALREYQAILATLPKDAADSSNMLNLAKAPAYKPGALVLKTNISYPGGKRRLRMSYDRFRGLERMRQDSMMMLTFTNESLGSLAFDLDGNPVAIALGERPRPGSGSDYDSDESNAMFRPANQLASELDSPLAVDASIVPLEENDQNQRVWLGVEWQQLNDELSRTLGVQKETRGGQSGLMITFLYPDSPAARAGLKENDILMRVHVEGHAGVYELPDQENNRYHNRYMRSIRSSSWLYRQNVLTDLLSEVGPGKNVTLDYLREGKPMSLKFTTEVAPPDFSNAPKCKLPGIGLTVKPLTYELRYVYLRKPDASGVVVDRTEPGSPAEVAGIGQHELITHIDGQPIDTPKHLREQVKARGMKPYELTIEQFGKTRLVRLHPDKDSVRDDPENTAEE